MTDNNIENTFSRLVVPLTSQCTTGRQQRRSEANDHKNYVPELCSPTITSTIVPTHLLFTNDQSETHDLETCVTREEGLLSCESVGESGCATAPGMNECLIEESGDVSECSGSSVTSETFLLDSQTGEADDDPRIFQFDLVSDHKDKELDHFAIRKWLGEGSPNCVVCFDREFEDIPLTIGDLMFDDCVTIQKLSALDKRTLCSAHRDLDTEIEFEPQLCERADLEFFDEECDVYMFDRYCGAYKSQSLWELHIAHKNSRHLDYISSLSSKKYAKKMKKLSNRELKDIEPQMIKSAVSHVLGDVQTPLEGLANAFTKIATDGFRLSDNTNDVLVDLSRTLTDIGSGGVKLSSPLMDEIGKLNNNLSEFTGNSCSVNHNVNIHVDMVSDIFGLVLKCKETVGILLCCIILMVMWHKGFKKMTLILAILGGLIRRYRADLVKRYDTLSYIFAGDVEPQMLSVDALKMLVTIAHLSIFKGVNSESLVDKFSGFYRHFLSVPPKVDNTMQVFGHYISLFQDLINQTCVWFNVAPLCTLVPDRYPLCTVLLREVEDFLKTPPHSPEISVSTSLATCSLLKSRIVDMLVKYKSDRDFVGDRVLLIKSRASLESYQAELELRGAGKDVTRVPPMAFLFMGKPSIGKSYMLKSLSLLSLYTIHRNDQVALDHIKNNQIRDYVFTRNSSDKYWEGYYNQTLVLLDEVGMQRDTASSDSENNEYSNFIKMVNDVPFPLLMANVEKKGTREFTSPVVLGTTNCFKFNIESITNPSAYDRRWTAFEVSVKKEYGKLRFGDGRTDDWFVPDFDKMRDMGLSEEDIALSRFLEFRPRTSVLSPGYREGIYSIDEVIELMKENLMSRDDEFESRKKQSNLLHEYFQRQFLPQSGGEDLCCCPSCSGDLNCVLNVEQLMLFRELLNETLDLNEIAQAYEIGYNRVTDAHSHLYTENFPCVKEWVKEGIELHMDPKHLCFMYGTMVMSAMQRGYVASRTHHCVKALLAIGKVTLKVLGFIASVLGTYTIMKGVYDCVFKATEPGGDNVEHEAQVTDLNSQEVLYRVLRRNVYALSDDIVPFRGFVTFIADNILAMPKHFQISWAAEVEVRGSFYVHLKRLGDNINHQVIKVPVEYFIDVDETFQVGSDDLVFLYLRGDQVQRHADIRKYCLDSVPEKGELVFPCVDRRTLEYSHCDSKFTKGSPVSYLARGERMDIQEPIMYNINTMVGDCGLPIAVKNPLRRSQKVFGIHVAGTRSRGVGISVPVTVGMLNTVIEYFGSKHSLIQAQYSTDPRVLLELNRTNGSLDDLFFPPLERVVPGKVNLAYLDPPAQPCATAIVPSPIFNKIGVPNRTKPARLRPFTNKDGVCVDPIMASNSKYHLSSEPLDLKLLAICREGVTNLWLNGPLTRHNPKVGPRLLTFEEAAAGIPGVRGLDGIPRGTSAGYPYVCYVQEKGKRDFFGAGDEYDFSSEACVKLKSNVEHILDMARRGHRLNHVYLDFPKDERRPIDRVEAGKTRKISASPLELTLSLRIMFGSLCQFVFENRIFNESAIGVNPFDREWDTIVSYLGTETRVIAGDHSNYDGHLPYVVMMQFLHLATSYYNDSGTPNERARLVLFQEIVNSRHMVNGTICEWVGSNASGNPLTPILNTFCNLVLTRYAVLLACKVVGVSESSKLINGLSTHIKIMAYGDDNLISVNKSSPFYDLVTQESLTDAFAKMGMEYTDETKNTGNTLEDRNITQVSFLKRGFKRVSGNRFEGRKWLSPLALTTILESIQWTKKKDFDFESNKENVRNMLQELSQHGGDVFLEYAPRIVSASKECLEYTPVPSDYEGCLRLILSRDGSFFH